MWELDCKQSWAPKNWHFWSVVLEKTLESPLDCKAIQPVHPKGDHSWVFIGRADVEAETPIFWPPDMKSWLIWKDPDAGKDWGQEEKGTIEDKMFGWHHQFNGHKFGWTPGIGDGQGGLACCCSWGCKESDMTWRLNWTEDNQLTGGNVMQGEMWKLNRFLLMKSVIFWLLSSKIIIGIRIILIRRIIKNQILHVFMDISAIWHQASLHTGFPDGASGEKHACQCRRYKRR